MLEGFGAILLHLFKKQAGEKAFEILSDQARDHIKNLLARNDAQKALRTALDDAETCLRQQYGDNDTVEFMIALGFSGAPEIEDALKAYPAQPDDLQLLAAIAKQIQTTLPKVDIEEANDVAASYLECVTNALFSHDLPQFTWRTLKNEIDLLHTDHEKLLAGQETLIAGQQRISDQSQQGSFVPYQPSGYTPLTPPPSNELSDLGELPPESRMTHTRNPSFVGREKDLLSIAKTLLHGSGVVGIVAAASVGMGGLGKTQLAVEFCYRYGRYFRGVHWLQLPIGQSETEELDLDSHIKAEIAACGREMGIETSDQDQLVNMTLRAWKQYGPRLVVMDNVEEVKTVSDWMPRLGENARLLLTSHRQHWNKTLNITSHKLGVLLPEESRQLLRDLAPHLKDHTDKELDKIGEKLGHLPQALDLAGRYIGDTALNSITPAEYLARLEKKANMLDHDSLVGDEGMVTPTKSKLISLNATFALSWEQLDPEKDALARSVFLCAGYCAPKMPIPRELLQQSAGDNIADEDFETALKRLHQTGLLQVERGYFTIHPLLAEYAQKVDLGTHLTSVVNVLSTLSYDATQTGLPASFVLLQPQIEHIANLAEIRNLERAWTLWNNLGFYMNMVGDYSKAEEFYNRALEFGLNSKGNNHSNIATVMNNLGLVLQEQGKLSQARVLLEMALDMEEKTLGPDHPRIATTVNNIGLLLNAEGNYQEAHTKFERALTISHEYFGHYHSNTARTLSNKGMNLFQMGYPAEAEAAFRESLQIENFLHDKPHPDVATGLNNLGQALNYRGERSEAQLLFEQALDIIIFIYGNKHPNMALVLNNLALSLVRDGKYSEAKEKLEQALAICQEAFGQSHPRVATVLNSIGGVLRSQGYYFDAKVYFEQALEIDKAAYGYNHLQVALRLNNLGRVYADLGDLDGCLDFLEQALRIRVQFLPPEHPEVKGVWEEMVEYRVKKIMLDEGVSEEEAIEIIENELMRYHIQRTITNYGVSEEEALEILHRDMDQDAKG